MTTHQLPGTGAARHGTGDADLTIMLAAHDAFRRDLVSLARAASAADRGDPRRREQVGRGWQVFKRQLHFHHTGEDQLVWPRLADRLAHSQNALSTLEAMEAEHSLVDPLLEAVDAAFADPAGDELAGAVDELVHTLHGHLAHEERDALPLRDRAHGEGVARGRRADGPGQRDLRQLGVLRLDARRRLGRRGGHGAGRAARAAAPAVPAGVAAALQQGHPVVVGS
jgi:hypothetical protein